VTFSFTVLTNEYLPTTHTRQSCTQIFGKTILLLSVVINWGRRQGVTKRRERMKGERKKGGKEERKEKGRA
jgi:hypothetical protein